MTEPNEGLQQKFPELSGGYVNEKPKRYSDISKPLLEADFCHEITPGIFKAQFDTDYLKQLRSYCKVQFGSLWHYLGAILTDLGMSENTYTYCYLNEGTVDTIIAELEFYVDHKRWHLVNDKEDL